MRRIKSNYEDVEVSPNQYTVNERGCWVWCGRISRGYAVMTGEGGYQFYVHVALYVKKYGLVPDDLELHHFVCNTKACINPDHVKPITHTENVRASGRKCSMELAQEIREERKKTGMTQRQLAKMFNMSKSNIGNILRGIQWGEVSTSVGPRQSLTEWLCPPIPGPSGSSSRGSED